MLREITFTVCNLTLCAVFVPENTATAMRFLKHINAPQFPPNQENTSLFPTSLEIKQVHKTYSLLGFSFKYTLACLTLVRLHSTYWTVFKITCKTECNFLAHNQAHPNPLLQHPSDTALTMVSRGTVGTQVGGLKGTWAPQCQVPIGLPSLGDPTRPHRAAV